MNVYVLKLRNGKYYIGSSNDPEKRFHEHLNGHGSSWTFKHPPIKIEKIYKNCDKFDEDKYTKIYMEKYGIDNVRGGTYCQLDISEYKKQLEKELTHSTDKCFKCGKTGHYAYKCKRNNNNKKETNNDEYSDNSEYENSDYDY